MATTTIPWGDGSGGNIYLTYPSASGDQTVSVSSDANTGAARTRTVIFTAGNVTQQLTVNQAAGSVSPVFYDRLVFDGTAYIVTDIVPPSLCSFRCRFGDETLKAQQRVFGSSGSSSSIFGMLYGSSTTTTRRYFSVYYGKSAAVATNRYLNFSYTGYSFFLTPNRFGWGDTSYTFTKGSYNPSQGLVLGTGASQSGQAYTGTMETFYIYGSDAQNATKSSDLNNFTPVVTLRPCTYNGAAGMWCVENNKFYGNSAGAGTLVAANS